MLDRISAARDKRQGSIIWDTLSPTAAELAQMNINIDVFTEQTYLLTATGINLDNRAADYGIVRTVATHAIRIGEMIDTDGNPIDLPVGSRFSTPNTAGGLNFALTENLEAGQCLLQCETVGAAGNAYLGALFPLFVINNLGVATMIGTYIPAEDEETDEHLRGRVLERINQKSYGGNVADYKQFTRAIPGVGDVKVFPVWGDGQYKPSDIYPPVGILDSISGSQEALSWVSKVYDLIISGYLALVGGPIILSIIDSEYNPATVDFIAVVQEKIDPIPHNGEGLGIAPIGHRVTVTTPMPVDIDISAALTLKTGYTITQLQASIENVIEAYLLELRREWADAGTISVFIARINAAIIGVGGVSNVTDITINGMAYDLALTQTSGLQQLPMRGEVTLTNA